MTKHDICRITAGVLMTLIGAAIFVGSVQLWSGAAASWADVIATDTAVKNTAKGMVAMAVILFVAGTGVIDDAGWGNSPGPLPSRFSGRWHSW